MNGKIKVMKAVDCYVKLYGRKAYDAYVKREAEIDSMKKDRRIKISTIVGMREANFRRMKEAGVQRNDGASTPVISLQWAARRAA